MSKIIIGVDLGGTKIMTGAINEKGEVLCEPVKVPTNGDGTCDEILKKITDSVEQVLHKINATPSEIEGIGIGSTGPLDIENGIILECPQLPSMHFFPLKKTIQNYFKCPVYINNDANCLIYGETIFGNAAGKKNVVGFTLGTGIGCAVILNGKIVNGARSAAGEIWTSPYDNGTIEDYISGVGVTRIYESISSKKESALNIFNLAKEGEQEAIDTWIAFGKHLATPLAWSINLLDPDVVILGGSITAAYPLFESSLNEHLKKMVCPVPDLWTPIELASLGNYAGFIGAACLVIEKN